MTKGELKALEFRTRAAEALARVDDATLDHVREQWRKAADTWTDMADAEDARAERLRRPPPGV